MLDTVDPLVTWGGSTSVVRQSVRRPLLHSVVTSHYRNTLIEVAEDCPATAAEVPRIRNGKKTRPVLEYEMVVNHPYEYTADDIAFETYALLHDIPQSSWPEKRPEFLRKSHPRLRVSALAKHYGWGIHVNGDGKAALIAVESPEYTRLVNDPGTTKVKAFRSKRA